MASPENSPETGSSGNHNKADIEAILKTADEAIDLIIKAGGCDKDVKAMRKFKSDLIEITDLKSTEK